MMRVANDLARGLHLMVVDDRRMPLGEKGLALSRAQIAGVEAMMRKNSIAPGSAHALRLFS